MADPKPPEEPDFSEVERSIRQGARRKPTPRRALPDLKPPEPAKPTLKAGQRRALENVLNPARFAEAPLDVQPSTAHTPVAALIIAAALLVIFGFVALPWATYNEASVTGLSALGGMINDTSGLEDEIRSGEPLQLAPLLIVLPAALFLGARAYNILLYRELPARGVWFWMIIAAVVGLYPFLHTLGILDYLADRFLGAAAVGEQGAAASPGVGFWLALIGLILGGVLAGIGRLFLTAPE